MLQKIDAGEVVAVALSELRKRDEQIALLTFQLEQLKRMVFGAMSERYVPMDPGQATLFDVGPPHVGQPATEQVSYTRVKAGQKKQPAVRQTIAAHLPLIERVLEPEGLPAGARKIGEVITETLAYTPGTIHVDKLVRPKCAHDDRVLIAPMPFPKSNLGPSLAAHICVRKFADHLTLYRQRSQLGRAGLEVSDSTIGGWFGATATLLEPLGDALLKAVLAERYQQVDDSPIPVQADHKDGSLRKGYHWVYHAPLNRTVFFDYRPGRSEKFPIEVLKDFQGTPQTDGYAAYIKLAQKAEITALACMAHARRKFEKTLNNDKARAEYAMNKIGDLYTLERTCAERKVPPDVLHRYRRRWALPVLKDIKSWMDREINLVAPKSPIGEALGYAITIWPRLAAYTLDGRYLIDNNRIENTIRPLAIGRKNYLLTGSDRAARHAALMYSLLGTCKLHGVVPFAYLRDVNARIPEHKANKLSELLPQRWQPLAK